jgi:hypothetical protein
MSHSHVTALQHRLAALLVFAAPFSLVPSIAMPLEGFRSFRIGAYQLAALLFVACTITPFLRSYAATRPSGIDKTVYYAVAILFGIVGYGMTASLRPGRSLLMGASFCFVIIVMLCARWYVGNYGIKTIIESKLWEWASIVYGLISILQLVAATVGANILLCSGCGNEVFGFVRISGFAAEPLFWANALLPFFAVMMVRYIKNPTTLSGVALSLVATAIGLTFSRGAYIALAAMIVVLAALYHSRIVKGAVVVLLSAVASAALLVGSATIAYRETPGIVRETASGIAEHLSFGRISFAKPVPARTEMAPQQVAVSAPEAVFDSQGYVAASTTERSGAAQLALTAWQRGNIPLGVGLGNLGPYVVANVDSTAADDLTVYIYYVLLLAETGLVGLALVLLLFFVAVYYLLRSPYDSQRIVACAVVGFMTQYWFFGSTINVIYIWFWLGIGLGLTSGKQIKGKH